MIGAMIGAIVGIMAYIIAKTILTGSGILASLGAQPGLLAIVDTIPIVIGIIVLIGVFSAFTLRSWSDEGKDESEVEPGESLPGLPLHILLLNMPVRILRSLTPRGRGNGKGLLGSLIPRKRK